MRKALGNLKIGGFSLLVQEIIEITYHGKGNQLIRTPDGVAEPRNRRVEITIR